MTNFEFIEWPKTPHLYREMVLSEKIDGQNGGLHFDREGNWAVQSRSRFIDEQTDINGFYQWVESNHRTLFEDLGEGIHFGEWWGYKIRRGYDCKPGERYFSLFNTRRWSGLTFKTPNLAVVPILFEGTIKEQTIGGIFQFWTIALKQEGSFAKPGYTKPEGLVIYHKEADQMFKIFLEKDDKPKSLHK